MQSAAQLLSKAYSCQKNRVNGLYLRQIQSVTRAATAVTHSHTKLSLTVRAPLDDAARWRADRSSSPCRRSPRCQSLRPPTLLRARPTTARRKCGQDRRGGTKIKRKKGQIGAALWGLDKNAIEKNQLRIWEELREASERREADEASGKSPRRTTTPSPVSEGVQGRLRRSRRGLRPAVALNKQLEDKGSSPRRSGGTTTMFKYQRNVSCLRAGAKTVKRKRGRVPNRRAAAGAGFSYDVLPHNSYSKVARHLSETGRLSHRRRARSVAPSITREDLSPSSISRSATTRGARRFCQAR